MSWFVEIWVFCYKAERTAGEELSRWYGLSADHNWRANRLSFVCSRLLV